MLATIQMEPTFKTSFIPKKPIGSPRSSTPSAILHINLLSIVATVFFALTVLASLGLFFYKNSLQDQIVADERQINDSKAAFQPDKIKELVDANTRIKSAKELLEGHVAVSKVLLLFNDLTLKKMQITDFEYAKKNNEMILSINSQVQTYNALAEQARVFKESQFLKNPMLNSFSLVDNGYLAANFSATIDPQLLSYKKATESPTQNQ